MKRSTTPNWRPLLRAVYAFLIGIAALWAMPRNAYAQLYITQSTLPGLEVGGVSEYDANTGVLMNATFITELNDPVFLALLDNVLFVANFNDNTVGQYDATSGRPMNPNFIPGLTAPEGLAVTGPSAFSPSPLLYVAVVNSGVEGIGGAINKYNANTGAVISTSFIFINGEPTGLAVMGPSPFFPSGFLFVANFSSGTVGKYDATTGAPINTSFITGLKGPTGLVLQGRSLLVANFFGNTVSKYDAITGARIKARFITGLNFPAGLALNGNKLYVTNDNDPGTVGEYNAITGARIKAKFITGLSFPLGVAVK